MPKRKPKRDNNQRPSGANYPLRLTDDQRVALEVSAEKAELPLSTWAKEVLLQAAGRPDLAPSGRFRRVNGRRR